MKRPIGHSVIAAFAIIFAFAALIATINTGDLFVRGFLIIAAITATIAAQAVWSGRRGAAKRVALWSIATAVLASAVFIYSRYYTLRQADESIASSAIAAALIISFCALYLERRPWARSVGAERGRPR